MWSVFRFMKAPPDQRPLLLYDATAREIERMIGRMCLDDAIVRRNWRLERLQLEYGREHYRLYWRSKGQEVVVGVVDILSRQDRARVERLIAMYLAAVGFAPRNARLVVFGAKTPLDAEKHYLPRLVA